MSDIPPRDLRQLKQRVQSQMWRRRLMNSLPLDEKSSRSINVPRAIAQSAREDRFEVVRLGNQPRYESRWRQLFARYAGTSLRANYYPWYRCLSILRAHGAKSCIIEKYYVCLDYKSEVISFYSLLDAAQGSVATRLHFFKEEVSEADVTELTEQQSGSYLGYIVCRSGGLPLVGRTILAPPEEIKAYVATISETVHFFGQQLEISGAPFMQQDAKFAVCSQVAIWVAHYTAYRRGIVQRRLIADIVELTAQLHPLAPRLSSGLHSWELPEVFRKAGLHSISYYTPNAGTSDYPRLRLDTLVNGSKLHATVNAAFEERDLADVRSANDAVRFGYDLANLARDGTEEQRAVVRQLFDSIYFYMFEPYIRSKFPVYCSTEDHAFALIGMKRHDDGLIFYLHDDGFGPYLATPTLLECSRDFLRKQSEHSHLPLRATNPQLSFISRSMDSEILGLIDEKDDFDYGVLSFAVPTPSRLVMTPSDADDDARAIFEGDRSGWYSRSTLMMGIDYKQDRFDYFKGQNDKVGCHVIGNLHLAEWVIVVEGYRPSETAKSAWELVYDGTTGGGECVLQVARLANTMIVSHPLTGGGPVSEVSQVDSDTLPFVRVPARIGKNR